MRKVHLTPRLKLWLILGTTVGLIVAALLALILVWGPPPIFETPSAATPLDNLSTSGSVSGFVVAPWPALAGTTGVPSGAFGARSNSNFPVLALGCGVALAMSFGALWAARRRRNSGVAEQVSIGLNAGSKVSPAISL